MWKVFSVSLNEYPWKVFSVSKMNSGKYRSGNTAVGVVDLGFRV
jgi:hypothetical protein